MHLGYSMSITEKIKRIVWGKSAARCAICKIDLLEETHNNDNYHLLGEVAHIVAEQRNGPRGNIEMTLEERNSESNLILLCLKHHKVIDDDDITYPIDYLKDIKRQHEQWIVDRLSQNVVWNTKLHQFYYINVPRLNLLCGQYGHSIDLSCFREVLSLNELGWDLNSLMLGFTNLLNQVELKAIPLEIAINWPDKLAGTYISFNHKFRTKNIVYPQSKFEWKTKFSGDLKSDPHIYLKMDGFKIICFIDKRWITTDTAFCQFRPSGGQSDFAGLGVINSVDLETKTIRMTPLVLGVANNPFIEAWYKDASSIYIDAPSIIQSE